MGSKGGKARAAKMDPAARSELARKAVSARWERIRQEANKAVAESPAGAWGGMELTPVPSSLTDVAPRLPIAMDLVLYYVLRHTLGEKDQPEFVRTSVSEIAEFLWWPEERIRWALTELEDRGILKVRNVGSGRKWDALLDVSPLIERWHVKLPELVAPVLVKDKNSHDFELLPLADRDGPGLDFVGIINRTGRPLFASASGISSRKIWITVSEKPLPGRLENRRRRAEEQLKASSEELKASSDSEPRRTE